MSVDVTASDEATDSESWTWTNRGNRAEVSMSIESTATGTVEVKIRDQAGTVVYEGSVSDEGPRDVDTITDKDGESGDWEVSISTSKFSGKANVDLDRYWP